MKSIVVAGCGHGGLSAASKLAKHGYDVTVVEKKNRDTIGFDWHDSLCRDTFEKSDIPCPDKSCFLKFDRMGYFNPAKTVKVIQMTEPNPILAFFDRKRLINHLIDYAAECGVKFIFDANITGAVWNSSRVTGIRYIKNGIETEIYGDMIIDACGVDSPVRKSLPPQFGIENNIDEKDVFCTWRGYFNKTENRESDPKSMVYFFHCGKPGMDWVLSGGKEMDVLVGGFGSLTEKDVETALKDFHKEYPYMGDKIVRGGTYERLPLRKALPVMVCNSYAAIGNSAYMTNPLSGSGIDMSMISGKILADTIIEYSGDFSVNTLWKYNYKFYKFHGEFQFNDLIIKDVMSLISADDIDFLMEKNIMSSKEIAGGGNTKYTFKEILEKAAIFSRPKLLLSASGILRKFSLCKKIKSEIPENYDEIKIQKWLKIYSKL